ncbi:MAG: hypothetical protein KatS3mg031_0558 [Chitinophagales bacterium]|nr:MAG: hypothetical protein KatS3mg031_0558 [Chitinophagales bacterium]
MPVIQVTDEDFEQKLAENKKVIVKYSADWCGQCRLFAPKYKRLSEDPLYSDTVFLDVNAEKNALARKKAGVKNLPFFAVFKNGQLVEGTATSKEETVIDLLQKLHE